MLKKTILVDKYMWRKIMKIKDAATGVPKYYYVCSTWWYPSADEVDEEEVTMSSDAVYNTLDEAINYQFENMSCLTARPDIKDIRDEATMYWDPVNDQLRMKVPGTRYRFLITRVNMSGGE